MNSKQEEKFIQMTEAPIGPLILRLAAPCIINMLVTAFYNMADTFFVGMLDNNSATAAVGVVFSVMSIIQATGFLFGQGSGIYISRELGKHNTDGASKMVATGFFGSLSVGLLICIVGQIFLEPLVLLLGATETIVPYAKSYLRVILLGAPWMATSFVMNNQLRYQGNAIYGMVGMTTGSILNIFLDPIMIFGMNLGVSGAAWATVISQFISFCLLLIATTKGSNLRIHLKNVQFSAHFLTEIAKGGLPSMARQSLASVATILLNFACKPYGDAVIAAMSVVQRIMMFAASSMLGFGQGFQPFCGFNFGAKKYSRMMKGYWFAVKSSMIFMILMGSAGIIFAEGLIALFRDDPTVIACGATALRFQCAFLFTHSLLIVTNMMTQTIGCTKYATILSISRQGLFFMPTILLLPRVLGLIGIQMAQSVSDVFAVTCAILILRKVMKKLSATPDGEEVIL